MHPLLGQDLIDGRTVEVADGEVLGGDGLGVVAGEFEDEVLAVVDVGLLTVDHVVDDARAAVIDAPIDELVEGVVAVIDGFFDFGGIPGDAEVGAAEVEDLR
jgi:hypothetical protein